MPKHTSPPRESLITLRDPHSERDFMSLEELRERMGISETVAYLLAKENRLPIPAVRVGRQYRFSRPAYEALLARQHGDTEDAID